MSCPCIGTTHQADCSEFDVWEDFETVNVDDDFDTDCSECGHKLGFGPVGCSACDESYTQWRATHPVGGQDPLWQDEGGTDTAPTVSKALTALPGVVSGPSVWSAGETFKRFRHCSHTLDRYTLLDGTEIYLSSKYTINNQKWSPDYSVYLDDSHNLNDSGFVTFLPWRDFGLPELPSEHVIMVARHVLAMARAGMAVEIACMGSHGRTGTFVAILECLAVENPLKTSNIIERVRSQHCDEAIENRKQERYIGTIRNMIRKQNMKG
jgi:protein-tyrosine phosphatase